MTQFWIGATDVNYLLTVIGSWHVGCYSEQEARPAVEYVKERGYVGTRTHYAPAIPEGTPAYELTDKGLEYIGRVCGERAMKNADKMRNWYRASAKKHRPDEQKGRADGS